MNCVSDHCKAGLHEPWMVFTPVLLCRVFTTLEQLALSEEKEANLTAALAATIAAERAAAESQQVQAQQRTLIAAAQVQ